jgi:hypothetical protein
MDTNKNASPPNLGSGPVAAQARQLNESRRTFQVRNALPTQSRSARSPLLPKNIPQGSRSRETSTGFAAAATLPSLFELARTGRERTPNVFIVSIRGYFFGGFGLIRG